MYNGVLMLHYLYGMLTMCKLATDMDAHHVLHMQAARVTHLPPGCGSRAWMGKASLQAVRCSHFYTRHLMESGGSVQL
jgi:hypothetical protein